MAAVAEAADGAVVGDGDVAGPTATAAGGVDTD